ncbi:putative ABC-type ATPase [Spirosoma lacussanchae]|uniref:zeta toxin family protein n=1 Tax=Spirosoma lacussanchae TaxID=1884249 RepID=UPI00148631C0|nr:zeta toxin family protein [Spirosoma lacussanchae]
MPTLTLFAGPNGSGKTTIVKYVRQNVQYPYPPDTVYLNADDLEQELRRNPFCDLRIFGLSVLPLSRWNRFVLTSTLTDKICQVKRITTEQLLKCVKLVHGVIIIRTVPVEGDPDRLDVDSYVAALIIDFIRYALIEARKSFAFETVMSHVDKLDIMQRAKEAGFTVRLYYITTRDADINVARVRFRVASGGHPVNEAKIRSRYIGSLDNLAGALRLSDEAFLFDNSTNGQDSIEVARKTGSDLTVSTDLVPDWYITYVEEKFLTS